MASAVPVLPAAAPGRQRPALDSCWCLLRACRREPKGIRWLRQAAPWREVRGSADACARPSGG